MKHTKKKLINGWEYRNYDVTKEGKKWKCENKIFNTLTLAQKHIDAKLDSSTVSVQNIKKTEQSTKICSEIDQTISLVDLMKIFIKEYDLPKPYITYREHSDKVTIRYRNQNSDIVKFSNLRDDLKDVKDYGKEYGYECFFRITIYPDDNIFLSLNLS